MDERGGMYRYSCTCTCMCVWGWGGGGEFQLMRVWGGGGGEERKKVHVMCKRERRRMKEVTKVGWGRRGDRIYM